MGTDTLSVLVRNQPGVLARVAGLFSRRGFNIHSLAVGPTERADVSRMTIVIAEGLPIEQVIGQLDKLIDVLSIEHMQPSDSVARELLLITVRAPEERRSRVLEVVTMFRGSVVDVAAETLTVEATGSSDKLDAFVAALQPFGITELVQSGTVALARGERTSLKRPLLAVARPA